MHVHSHGECDAKTRFYAFIAAGATSLDGLQVTNFTPSSIKVHKPALAIMEELARAAAHEGFDLEALLRKYRTLPKQPAKRKGEGGSGRGGKNDPSSDGGGGGDGDDDTIDDTDEAEASEAKKRRGGAVGDERPSSSVEPMDIGNDVGSAFHVAGGLSAIDGEDEGGSSAIDGEDEGGSSAIDGEDKGGSPAFDGKDGGGSPAFVDDKVRPSSLDGGSLDAAVAVGDPDSDPALAPIRLLVLSAVRECKAYFNKQRLEATKPPLEHDTSSLDMGASCYAPAHATAQAAHQAVQLANALFERATRGQWSISANESTATPPETPTVTSRCDARCEGPLLSAAKLACAAKAAYVATQQTAAGKAEFFCAAGTQQTPVFEVKGDVPKHLPKAFARPLHPATLRPYVVAARIATPASSLNASLNAPSLASKSESSPRAQHLPVAAAASPTPVEQPLRKSSRRKTTSYSLRVICFPLIHKDSEQLAMPTAPDHACDVDFPCQWSNVLQKVQSVLREPFDPRDLAHQSLHHLPPTTSCWVLLSKQIHAVVNHAFARQGRDADFVKAISYHLASFTRPNITHRVIGHLVLEDGVVDLEGDGPSGAHRLLLRPPGLA